MVGLAEGKMLPIYLRLCIFPLGSTPRPEVSVVARPGYY